ncbi:MAG: hypothetical protein NT165_01340 [Candidatus Falkowbacteria bacterium]|nr:hypothetical protein [Candidatus Falkowbacteria bacterium]
MNFSNRNNNVNNNVNNNNNNVDPDDEDDDDNNDGGWFAKMLGHLNLTVADLIKIVSSFVLSLFLFWLFRNVVLSGIQWYWLRSLVALGIVSLLLAAVKTAISGPSVIAKPTMIWLLFWFFLGLALTYLTSNPEDTKKDKKTEITNPNSVTTLQPGTYKYAMAANEKIGSFQLPESGKFRYLISSSLPKNEWTISFLDGTSYDGVNMTEFPEKENPVFTVKALKGQVVTIEVVAR